MSTPDLITYPDKDLLVMGLADRLSADLKAALLTHEHVSFAVAGGTSPGPVFKLLSAVSLDWDRVTVLPTDERCVPPDHARSNARLIRETLLQGPASAARFQPLFTDAQSSDQVSASVAKLAPISVALLGMGADMHTASLFPGADGLSAALDADAPAIVPVHPSDQPEARLSLSGPILQGALRTHLLITGLEKRAALEKATTRPVPEAPVRLILETATVHWSE